MEVFLFFLKTMDVAIMTDELILDLTVYSLYMKLMIVCHHFLFLKKYGCYWASGTNNKSLM